MSVDDGDLAKTGRVSLTVVEIAEGSADSAEADVEVEPDFGTKLRDGSAQLLDELREAAGEVLDEQKLKAAGAVRGVANAIRMAAERLDEGEAGIVADYATRAADHVEALSDVVRDRSVPELVAEAEHAARREPEWFLIGAATAGFLIGRFLKASEARSRSRTT